MRTEAFADWLDVTFPPTESFRVYTELSALFASVDGLKLSDGLWELGPGKAKLGKSYNVDRVSLSGGVLAHLRAHGVYSDVLSVLAEGPHRVTRLDAAVDSNEDGADVLDSLRGRYPRGQVRLSQRPVKVTEMLSTREDGRRSGTWYAGHRSGAEVTCRVYDKALEVLQRQGESIPARTRYELTVRKGPGPTLRDAHSPERLFWHYMSPAILEAPSGVPEWDSGWGEGWTMERVELLPAESLRKRVERSGDLAAMVELADAVGPEGRRLLCRWISERVSGESSSRTSHALEEVSEGSKAAHN